jgi:hypothetical protein
MRDADAMVEEIDVGGGGVEERCGVGGERRRWRRGAEV